MEPRALRHLRNSILGGKKEKKFTLSMYGTTRPAAPATPATQNTGVSECACVCVCVYMHMNVRVCECVWMYIYLRQVVTPLTRHGMCHELTVT